MSQADQTVTDEQYVNRWESHIDDLTRLGWNLSENDRERLFDIKDELKDLVEIASENR